MIHSDSDSPIYSEDESDDVSLDFPDPIPLVQPATPTTPGSGSLPTSGLPPASPQALATHQRSDSRGSATQLAPEQVSEARASSPRARSRSPSPILGGSCRQPRRSRLVTKEDMKNTPRGKRESLERELQLGQEQIRDKRLLYVLVARCIAFPIQKRPKVDVTVPPVKLSKGRYEDLLKRFKSYLAAEDATKTADEPDNLRQFVKLFHERILQSPQVAKLAEDGNISTAELKHLFAVFAHRQAGLLVKHAGSSSSSSSHDVEHTCALWVDEVEGACFADEVQSKERAFSFRDDTYSQGELYQMFQEILGVSALDHQMFAAKKQLADSEDQEAVLRRELQQWKEQAVKMDTFRQAFAVPDGGLSEMHRQQKLQKVTELSSKLDSHIFSPAVHAPKSKKGDTRPDLLASSIPRSVNLDLRVTILEATSIKELVGGKPFFITFQTDTSTLYQTQIVKVTSDYVRFDTEQTFRVTTLVPELRINLCVESSGIMSDAKTLAKNVINPYPTAMEATKTITLQASHSSSQPKLKLSIDFKRPPHITKCGFLYCQAQGGSLFQTWKKRFFAIVQLSEYKFILCHYQPKTTHPKQLVVLEGYVADYSDTQVPQGVTSVPPDGEMQFALVKDDSRYQFGTDKDKEREQWVKALYRATGQTQQPGRQKVDSRSEHQPESSDVLSLVDLAGEPVVEMNHAVLYKKLLQFSLEYQMGREDFSRGILNDGIKYVLEEYRKRYLLRTIDSELSWLECYLDAERKWHSVNPAILYPSLLTCSNFTKSVAMRKVGSASLMADRSDVGRFSNCCIHLEAIYSGKVKDFQYHFPFGMPRNDLQHAMKMVEFCVETTSLNDMPSEMVREQTAQRLAGLMRDAALKTYQKLLEGREVVASTEELQKLADNCIAWNDDFFTYYADEFSKFPVQLRNLVDSFWNLFESDMRNVLTNCAVSDSLLGMFTKLNSFFTDCDYLKGSTFHNVLQEAFFPLVVQRFDTMQRTTAVRIQALFKDETWIPSGCEVNAVKESLCLMEGLKGYLVSLNWPNAETAVHLEKMCCSVCNEQLQDCTQRIMLVFSDEIRKLKVTPTGSIPVTLCAMLNGLWCLRLNCDKLCRPTCYQAEQNASYHEDIEGHITERLKIALKAVVDKAHEPVAELTKALSDMGSTTGFSFFRKVKPSSWNVTVYVKFVEKWLGTMSVNIHNDVVKLFLLQWYASLWDRFDDWLRERIEVHLKPEQLEWLSTLLEVIPKMCREQGLAEQYLQGTEYSGVRERVKIEASNDS